MKEKNIVTFLKTIGKLDSHDVCLNKDSFDVNQIEKIKDLYFVKKLRISCKYELDGKELIDIKYKNKIYEGFNLYDLCISEDEINKQFQEYLNEKNN